jgi:putative ABC transport system permease protein
MIRHLISAVGLFRSQKLRFLLTVSGIVVGIGTLVLLASLLSVGDSVLNEQSFRATGDDVVTVQNDWDAMNDDPDAVRLGRKDFEALDRSALLEGETISANYGMHGAKAIWNGEDFEPRVIGLSPTSFDVYRLEIGKGRTFSPDEYADARRVVVIGAQVMDGRITLGDTIRIEGAPYIVVGIMKDKAEMGPGGQWSWNNRLMVPDRTYNLDFNPNKRPNAIVVRTNPPIDYAGPMKEYSLAVRDLIDGILSRAHDGKKSWRFEGAEEEGTTGEIIAMVIKVLIYLTTVFSMVVGGINIMNIMLVTVAERTREIGLRRALGATRSDILMQFLAETVAVTWLGAVIGVVGAVALIALASAALTHWVVAWPFRVEIWSLILGVVFATGIGLLFGMYPAWRASRLDPVEALRTE